MDDSRVLLLQPRLAVLLPVGLGQPASKASHCCHLQFIILLSFIFFFHIQNQNRFVLKSGWALWWYDCRKLDGWKPFWLQLRQTHKGNASLCTPGGVTKPPLAASSVVSIRILARLSIKDLAVCVFTCSPACMCFQAGSGVRVVVVVSWDKRARSCFSTQYF